MSDINLLRGILLALLCSITVAADLGKTFQYCCALGREHALSFTQCETNKVKFPIRNVRSDQQNICASTIKLCCLQYWRNAACNSGKQAAKERAVCDTELKTDEDISFKYCCEACKLGAESGTLGSCDIASISLSSPWSEVFSSCCVNVTLNRNTSSAMSDNIFAKRGFLNRCETSNPCQQNCYDNGASVLCSCNSGYELLPDNTSCRDVNECETSPCENKEVCINTIGSYRCDCDIGFHRDRIIGACVDVNECQVNLHNCDLGTQRCDNTIGSYHCVRSVGCGTGYTFNSQSEICEDDNECLLGTNDCKSLGPEWECKNTLGSFRCEKIKRCNSANCTRTTPSPKLRSIKSCMRGFQRSKEGICIDIDECKVPSTCKAGLKCINTVGSYICAPSIICSSGLRLNETTNQCTDIDECGEQPGLCDHMCINVWGRFVCACQPGFLLYRDNRSCVDINECEMFKDRRLCAGTCVNIPGSYRCQCPEGYRLSPNGAWCQDIDECATGISKCGPDEICFNTRGSYRCNTIQCPMNYERDQKEKNRCRRTSYYCTSDYSEECLRTPLTYFFSYVNLVSNVSLPTSGYLELINLHGWLQDGIPTVDLSLKVAHVRLPVGVPRAQEDYFHVNRVAEDAAVVMLKRSIIGPQDVELHLNMSLHNKGIYLGFNIIKLFIYVSPYDF